MQKGRIKEESYHAARYSVHTYLLQSALMKKKHTGIKKKKKRKNVYVRIIRLSTPVYKTSIHT